MSVAKGADRTFDITPNEGYVIEDVQVDGSPIGPMDEYTFENVQSNHEILAMFGTGEEGYTLTVTVDGQGSVARSPDQTVYDDGTVVTLTALGSTNWEFERWEGALTGSANPAEITMNGNKNVTAVFTQGEYTLAITIDGQGSVAKDPDRELYGSGAVVTLTPAGDPGWAFDNWTGDLTGTNNPAQITMDGDRAVTAHFVAERYILQTFVDGGGELTVDPVQVDYGYGDQVTITAAADAGWEFDHWEGGATGSDNPLTVTMDSNKVITAFFVQSQYELSITINGDGTVTKDPDQATYTYGTVVTLTGLGGVGYGFDSWEGDATGSENPITVVMDGDKSVTANFLEKQYVLDVILDGSGSVARDPDQATYTHGTEVTLTASAATGWEWDQWSGDATGTDNPVVVTIDGNKTVTASFTQIEFLLNLTVDGAGSVTVDPAQPTYPADTVVTLTAAPDAGAVFNNWDGDVTGTANPVQLTMDSDKDVTAYFALPTILVVDDDGTASHEDAYTAALDANGFSYDVWSVSSSGSPGWMDLMDYNIAIWLTGELWENTVTAEDQVALINWLDCGGRLFLSSQEVLYDNSGSEPFFTDYLHVGSHVDDEYVDIVTGTGDAISGNTDSITLDYPFTNYADDITTDGVSQPSFENENGALSGITSEVGPFRTVFFSFPFEALPNSAPDYHRDRIMNNIIAWLSENISSSSAPPTVEITSPQDQEVVAGYTNITVDLGTSACVSHVSYNVDGGAWVSQDTPPFNYFWDSREVANGVHTLCAQAFGFEGSSSVVDCVEVMVDQSAVGPVNKYAVVAGISDYPGGGDLSYCDEDASDWYNYLDGKGYLQEVYGDGHPNDFPQYDGEATVANLRDAVVRTVSMADENDIVVLAFSGHGSGNGSGNSYYVAYDGGYDDDELAADLQNSTAGSVFVFFDSCFSGGMIDDIMDLNTTSHIYVSTTCTEAGLGYDRPDLNNGAWTGYFVDMGLKENFNYENVAMETCHAWADGEYMDDSSVHNPDQGDNNASITLHLDEPPWFPPKGSEDQPYWSESGAGTPLMALLEGGAELQAVRRDDPFTHKESLPGATLDRPELIQAVLAQLNPDQSIKEMAARCWFGYSMQIRDSHGNDMGTLGMCYGPKGYYRDHPAVFVMPREEGKPPVRYGLRIPDGAALANMIEERL